MKERVIRAMHTVWGNRCKEICRDVEFGCCHGILPTLEKRRFIQIARSTSTPDRIVGIFHSRPIDEGEFELMNERHFSPPVHESTLPKFYRVLLHNGEGLSWVPNWLEKEALAER
jgi:hypothetical protein